MSELQHPYDHSIDRVLQALHAAEPSPQMEQHLLAKLEAHRALPRPARSRAWIFALPIPVLALAALLFVMLHSRTATRNDIASTHSPAPRPHAAHADPPPPSLRAARHVERRPTPETLAAPAVIATLSPEEQLALEDFRAPTQVAPPLPLTAQERALMRAARKHNETQLAELLPSTREARLAAERAAFQKFFTPPPPIPQPQVQELLPNGDTSR